MNYVHPSKSPANKRKELVITMGLLELKIRGITDLLRALM